MDTIDILLATYNGEMYIKEQIESILNQTYKNFNLIISDDHSTDNTVDILKEFEKKDKRIKLFCQEENQGYIKNFEFLLRQVKNEIYMLSDQDDFWLPEKVEKSYSTLKKQKADLAFGDLEIVDANLNTIDPSFNRFMKLNRKIKKYLNTNKLNYLYNCITGCTLISRKKFIEKVLPLPSKNKYVAHDHWIGIILSLNGTVAYIPEKYIKYRQHGNNQIGTDKISHKFSNINDVRKLFIDVKLGIFETYVEKNEVFPEELRNLNKRALEYYKSIVN